MEYKDYYKILEVPREASADDIKKSYRKLARRYHPDVSKEVNAEEKFKELQEAYDVLKNPEKRKAFDQLGANWKAGQGFNPPPNWNYQGGNGAQSEDFDAAGFSDFFRDLFGQRGQSTGPQSGSFKQRGQDQHARLTITLSDSYHGAERTLELQQAEINPHTGEIGRKVKSIKVKIPTGITSGQSIRLSGQGSPGFGGGPNGDLYIEISIAEDPLFTLDGKNIFLNLPLSPWEAALGSKISTPTLGGMVDLSIPEGSQTGQKLRLKGRGLPGNPPGDQFVILKVYVPKPKNDAEKALYQKMAESMHFNPREELLVRR
jgi:curved DNA-binding protein